MQRNLHLTKVSQNYLFLEISRRVEQFLAHHPKASLVNLGVGNTTEPLSGAITAACSDAALKLATKEGYSGYGPEQGNQTLRRKIAREIYSDAVHPDEIYISDGAKCDIGRLQTLFGSAISIAVQDPTYPVYVDGSLLQGVKEVIFMPCHAENQFFPCLDKLTRTDLIYFCSPNNPTGAATTKEQLEELVLFAKKNRSIILFDAAYASFIQDPLLPRSIFEIEGAREVAIEINSFSKLAGFTGVRLGWTVVPEALLFDDGSSVKADWHRLISTLFNGASNLAQAGGMVALEEKKHLVATTEFYLENASLLKRAFEALGVAVFGGVHAPYLWVQFKGEKSWDVFERFLERYHLVTTPGSGFGREGEGFLRLTAFGSRERVQEAVNRLSHL